jgi:hypothetical protein
MLSHKALRPLELRQRDREIEREVKIYIERYRDRYNNAHFVECHQFSPDTNVVNVIVSLPASRKVSRQTSRAESPDRNSSCGSGIR